MGEAFKPRLVLSSYLPIMLLSGIGSKDISDRHVLIIAPYRFPDAKLILLRGNQRPKFRRLIDNGRNTPTLRSVFN